MTLASVLAMVDGRAGSESALRTALLVGDRFEAYVEALHVRDLSLTVAPAMPVAMSSVLIQQMFDVMEAQVEERARVARSLFETHCVAAGIRQVDPVGAPEPGAHCTAFVEVGGYEAEETANRGKLFDLVVFGRPVSPDIDRVSPALQAALFETARPVLLAPAEAPGSIGARVVVAWDNSLEATRAAVAAMAFAERAETLTVVSLEERGSVAEPADMARYYARHGIQADTRSVDPDGRSLGQALLDVAGEVGADLLVTGAYGRSRLREYIFGGVTKDLIADAPLAVFMAH